MKNIKTPLDDKIITSLKAGDEVLISGVIFTARDQAHLRLIKLMEKNKELPVDLKGQVIYYCGPTPSGKRVIGSCGPTTSGRMDKFTPQLLEAGMRGMIGKGRRSGAVREAIKREKAVYFVAPAGAGAYLSRRVKSSQVIAFEDLEAEAIYKLEVKDFPAVVAIDCEGRDIYSKM
ncbi:MAG: FumA C-terminus/TtdB family hydratase beta subunit [Candidatus Omnitrophota bacterium]|jgi:fumarate hydratase subunit beta